MSSLVETLAGNVDVGEVTGLVAVVARGSDAEVTVLGDQAVGGGPMREDSLFRISSIGKPITAIAVLTLVADGHVHLEDPIGEVLPELAAPRVVRALTAPTEETVAAVRPITVRDLLRSTNGHGFPSEFSAPAAQLLTQRLHQGPPQPQLVPAPDAWMAILGEIPLLHQPGEGFTYNTAFDILGVFVARVSGRSFAEYVDDRIFGPLGMTDTGFAFPPGSLGRAPTYYRPGEDGALVLVDAFSRQGAGIGRSSKIRVSRSGTTQEDERRFGVWFLGLVLSFEL